MDKVRVGVIGTSQFAEILHLDGLHSHPQAELAAICGRNQERAHEVARKYGARRVYADYRELIDHGEVDAVVVVTPDDLHAPMTLYALEAGKHVLCEKPLALTAADARRMYETAERQGVKHMTYFTYRWMPAMRYMRSLIEEGYVGQPYYVALQYVAGGSRNARYRWRYDATRANGVSGDLASHMIDLARWLAGDVVAVQAQLSAFASRPGEDGAGTLATPANDDAQLLLQFANGARGTIHATNVALTKGQTQRVAVHGAAGALEAELSLNATEGPIRGGRHDDGALAALDVPDAFFGGLDRTLSRRQLAGGLLRSQPVGDRLFIDCILGDQPVEPSFHDGWKAQQVIEAALESDRTGRRVTIAA